MAININKQGEDNEIDFFSTQAAGKINGEGRKKELMKQVVNKPESGFNILGGVGNVIGGINKVGKSIEGGIGNLVGGAVSAIPGIVGNITGGLSDVGSDVVQKIGGLFGAEITDEQKSSLGNFFREKGIKDEAALQNLLGTDPESFMTKTGAFGTEIASLFTPIGLSKVVPAIAKSKGLIGAVKEGAKLGAKGELVSEGEISMEGLLVGGITGGTLNVAGKGLTKVLPKTKEALEKKLADGLKGITKISAKGGKSSATAISEQMKSVEGGKTLQKLNPTFKITSKDTAIKEVGETITSTKDKLFTEMTAKRGTIQGKINAKEILDEMNKLTKDTDFKALLKEGGGEAEFNRLVSLLKDSKGNPIELSPADLYSKIKTLNISAGKELTSSDASKSKIHSAASKVYNDILDKKMGSLGGEYRALNKAYSDIRKFEDGIAKELKKLTTSGGGSQLQNLGDAYLDSSIVFNAFGNPMVAAQSLGTKVTKAFLNDLKNPNTVIKKFMDNARLYYGLDTPIISEGVERIGKEVIKGGSILGTEKLTK